MYSGDKLKSFDPEVREVAIKLMQFNNDQLDQLREVFYDLLPGVKYRAWLAEVDFFVMAYLPRTYKDLTVGGEIFEEWFSSGMKPVEAAHKAVSAYFDG